MSKVFFFIVVSFFIASTSLSAQSVHKLTVELNNSRTFHLKQFSGKKILIIGVEVSLSDSIKKEIDIFQERYMGSCVVVVMPIQRRVGVERVSSPQDLSFSRGKFGYYILKTSASGDSSVNSILYNWLTDHRLNGHFQFDSIVAFQKFVLDEDGRLYGAVGPEFDLQSRIVDRIVQAQR